MTAADALETGRESFRRQAWTDAYAQLSTADSQSALEPEDLIRLAMAAYLIGRDADSVEILTRTHQECVSRGEIALAVRCSFWIGFQLINKGDMAQAGGWFARGGRLLEESRLDCVEKGYLLVPAALQNLYGGDFEKAYDLFDQARDIGARFADADLTTLASLGRGQAVIGRGDTNEGVTLLDEVMIGVTTGETSAIITGLVYCAVISACYEILDLRRVGEWTDALSRWCDAQPDLVPYRGQCLVHRSQIMQLRGLWTEALGEAERARDQFSSSPDRGAIGLAFYQLGEVLRLRGDFAGAEAAYRDSNQAGHAPQPGLAVLRLAQGQTEAAEAAIRRVVDEAQDPYHRYRVLPAYVDIMLAVGDLPAARAGADELQQIASGFPAAVLQAAAQQAQGAVFLAEGDPRSALRELRAAWMAWQDLEAPHEAARTQALMGLACRALGDEDTAKMELETARRIFQQLGAMPDAGRVENAMGLAAPSGSDGLTGREVEVLALLATGKTNREIAADLVISEKTVARHVSNIFVKLGVTTRAAATAYAFKHDLV